MTDIEKAQAWWLDPTVRHGDGLYGNLATYAAHITAKLQADNAALVAYSGRLKAALDLVRNRTVEYMDGRHGGDWRTRMPLWLDHMTQLDQDIMRWAVVTEKSIAPAPPAAIDLAQAEREYVDLRIQIADCHDGDGYSIETFSAAVIAAANQLAIVKGLRSQTPTHDRTEAQATGNGGGQS